MEQTRKPPYSRRQLQRFLAALDAELARSSSEQHTLVVGGGYVMSHQVYMRRTNDVDVISDGLTAPVADAARAVAMQLGITATWINAAASGIQIPVEQQLTPIYEGSVLTVFSPGLRYVLAMKLRAARRKDFRDCVALIQQLRIDSEAEVQELAKQACGHPGNMTAERQQFAGRAFARSRKRRLIARVLQRRRARAASRSVAESNSPTASPRIDHIDTRRCPRKVQSNGNPCILRRGHRGHCRSSTGRG